MDSNKISNQKVEVSKGMTLNDKDYINDLLNCLKSMEKDYVVALTEVSNESLYEKYYNQFFKLASLQREVYELMFKFGWYSLEKAESQKISDKYQTLNQELQDLNQ